jgi:hypothetical protein
LLCFSLEKCHHRGYATRFGGTINLQLLLTRSCWVCVLQPLFNWPGFLGKKQIWWSIIYHFLILSPWTWPYITLSSGCISLFNWWGAGNDQKAPQGRIGFSMCIPNYRITDMSDG